MKTYHLVDTENMPVKWIELFESGEDNKIFLFRLDNSGTNNKNYISLDDLEKISNQSSDIIIANCFHGKPKMNALDFQLSSYLGYLICAHIEDNFIIYSNDTGFDPVIEYWKNKGINIKQISENENN